MFNHCFYKNGLTFSCQRCSFCCGHSPGYVYLSRADLDRLCKGTGLSVKDFVKNTNNTLESNCISINRNGSVGYAFYHPYYAIFSNDCRKLIVGMDKYVSLFIANQIKLQKEKYNYSYKMGTNRIKRQKIMLPSDDKGNPDYMFMSDYMLYLERSLLERYLDFLY